MILKPWRISAEYIDSLPGSALISGTLGLLVGLVVASLVSIPLYSLSGWPGWGVPVIVSVVLGIFGLTFGVQRERDMRAIFPGLNAPASYGDHSMGSTMNGAGVTSNGNGWTGKADKVKSANTSRNGNILVDTSAIIDGRIADLSITGFLEGSLVVPRFVLDELRHIADSSDPLRRNRGRRGLEVLGKLRKDEAVPLQVLDVGVENGNEVDAVLVQLAREMKSAILTTDYNLNRVAELQGVQVLNVNELANALKSIVLPGEELRVNIVQEGKESGQGVAYLDDGTMVVVEGGRRYLNAFHDVSVTRVLQTAAGRIIFANPKGE
ncbi:MAG: PIN domain-containing protein [Dehalococcoidia bacterium]|nr:PIN domain-containing protein [Dehalococcoidia bacterium]